MTRRSGWGRGIECDTEWPAQSRGKVFNFLGRGGGRRSHGKAPKDGATQSQKYQKTGHDGLTDDETGRLLLEFDGADAASQAFASEVGKAVHGKTVLGLVAEVGAIPARPSGPVAGCKVRVKANEATVQVSISDADAKSWVPVGKFTLPIPQEKGKTDI